MVRIYVRLILAGRKTIDDVPEKIRAEVQAELEKESPLKTETTTEASGTATTEG